MICLESWIVAFSTWPAVILPWMKDRSFLAYSLGPDRTFVVRKITRRTRRARTTQPRKILLGVICLERWTRALHPPDVCAALDRDSLVPRVPPVRAGHPRAQVRNGSPARRVPPVCPARIGRTAQIARPSARGRSACRGAEWPSRAGGPPARRTPA